MKKTKIKPPPNWEDTPQSFERFEKLAKELMAVPKKELNKEPIKQQKRPKETKGRPSR